MTETLDEYSEYYADLLEDTYDCVDRIVLNAYFCMGQRAGGFRTWWRQLMDSDDQLEYTASPYSPRQAAYDLKKLRGKNLVRKIVNSRRYEPVPEGLQNMAALLVLREKVLKPVLAGAGKPRRGPKPKHQSQVDLHYANMHTEMRLLFQTIGIAV